MRIGIGEAAVAALAAVAAPVVAQDAAAGGVLFKQRCQMCHATAPGARATLGPHLAGVAGRPAAATDFAYTPAFRKAALVWDRATLDRFLAAPGKTVPGTRMVSALPDPRQRGDVIAYLMMLGR